MYCFIYYMFSCMIVDNASFEEEQMQSFEVKESNLSLEKGK
jgi:hypothetical protein